MYSDPEGVAVLSREEDRDAFSVGIVIVVLRGWRSSSLPKAINLLPFGQRKYLVAAGSRAVKQSRNFLLFWQSFQIRLICKLNNFSLGFFTPKVFSNTSPGFPTLGPR